MVKRPAKNKKGEKPKGKEGKRYTSMYASGDDIIEKAKADSARRKMEAEKRQGGRAFRFFVGKGEEKEIIILDKNIRAGLGITQHRLAGKRGHFNRFEPCIGNDDNCPLCKAEIKDTYFVMLTVLDLTGYKNRKGKKIPYDRKLLAITSNQLEQFTDLEEANGGSLRGMYLVMKRGQSDTSYGNGEPKPQKEAGGKSFQIYSEKELKANYGNEEKRKDGKVVKVENEDITPFNYKKLFPPPSQEYIDALREEFDEGDAPAGSRKSNSKSWKDDDSDDEPEDDDDDDADSDDDDDDDKPKGRKAKAKVKGKKRASDDDDDDSDDDDSDSDDDDSDDDDTDADDADDDDDDDKPAKKKGKSARGRASRDDDDDDDDSDSDDDDSDEDDSDDSDSDDDDDDDKPAKKKKAGKAKPKRKVRNRDDDDDDSDSDDDDDSDDDTSDDDDADSDDDDDDDKPKKKKPSSKVKPKSKAKKSDDDDDDDDSDSDDDDSDDDDSDDSDSDDDDADDDDDDRPAKKKKGKGKPFARR